MRKFAIFFIFILAVMVFSREWSIEELLKLEIAGIRRLIEMRGEECSGCTTKKDYMRKMLSTKNEEVQVSYTDPNDISTIFENRDEDVSLIQTDPIFLNRQEREKRYILLARMQANNFDTARLTTFPITNKNIRTRRNEWLDLKEKEGMDITEIKALWEADEYDFDEL